SLSLRRVEEDGTTKQIAASKVSLKELYSGGKQDTPPAGGDNKVVEPPPPPVTQNPNPSPNPNPGTNPNPNPRPVVEGPRPTKKVHEVWIKDIGGYHKQKFTVDEHGNYLQEGYNYGDGGDPKTAPGTPGQPSGPTQPPALNDNPPASGSGPATGPSGPSG